MKKWYQYWTVWAAIAALAGCWAPVWTLGDQARTGVIGAVVNALALVAIVFFVAFALQYNRAKKAAREAAEAAHAAELRAAWAKKQVAEAAAAAAREAEAAKRAAEIEAINQKYAEAREAAAARDEKRKAEYLQQLADLPAENIHVSDSPAKAASIDVLDGITYSTITARTPRDKLGNFVVIDTETTGLSPNKCQIIDIAAIRFRDWLPVEKFSSLLSAGRHIPASATKINGITDDMVAGKPQFAQVAQALVEFVGKDNVVGHNIKDFDMPFVVLGGADLTSQKRKYYDTLIIARRTLKREHYNGGDVANYKLHTLCEYYDIPHYDTHRAENDAISTGYLLQSLAADRA